MRVLSMCSARSRSVSTSKRYEAHRQRAWQTEWNYRCFRSVVRTKKIQKKSIGGIREVNEDLKSMKLSSANSFIGQDILIIDDVATTWTTMKAARRLIEAQGLPKNLVSLVLSRTLPQ